MWPPPSGVPSLVGHLLFGVGTALVFVLLHGPGDRGQARSGRRRDPAARAGGRRAGRAGAAGRPGGPGPGGRRRSGRRLAQAALSPRSDQGIGAALVRGQGYGFVAWVVGELTVPPLLADAGLRWSLPEARASFPGLPGWLLLGALVAVACTVLDRLAPLLSSEHLRAYRGATAGSGVLAAPSAGRGGRAARRGGHQPAHAARGRPRGRRAAHRLQRAAGRDRRQPGHRRGHRRVLRAAVPPAGPGRHLRAGWGLSYGFLWWILGPLTLLPALLGGDPEWSAAAAGGSLSALAGHLVYGGCLGVAFYLLEAPFGVPWLARTRAEAVAALRCREELLAATPRARGRAAGHAADAAGRDHRRLGRRGSRQLSWPARTAGRWAKVPTRPMASRNMVSRKPRRG